MRKLIIIFLFIPVTLFSQTVLTKPYRTFVNCHGEWTDPLYDYAQSTTYTHHQNEEWDNAGAVVAEIIDTVTPLPESGFIELDKLYSWEGLIVRCRQSHQRTIYDPTETLALFTIYRPAEENMQWIAGEQVDVGTLRMYNGVQYECIQAHVTQSDWTPDATPALWSEVVEPSDEWQAGVSYSVGDIVTYEGHTYECRQSHTSISTWYPSAVPALWLLIE